MKLSDIQTNVLTNMLGMDVDPGDMNRWINDAQYDLASVAKLKGSYTINMQQGVTSYTLPADYRSMVNVAMTGGFYLDKVPVGSSQTGYYIWGNTINVYPAPQDNSQTLTLLYYAWPVDLANNDDVSIIPAQFHRGLVFYCTAQAKRKYMMGADAQDMDNQYQLVKQDLATFAEDGPKQIRNTDGQYGNPAIPYGSPLDDRWW